MIAGARLKQLLGTASDEDLVRRVAAGERDLYEVLVRRHNARLYRVVRSIVDSEGDAEDVMQETYVRAYERLAQFEGRGSFAAWLRRIAVRESIERVRRRTFGDPASPTSDAGMDVFVGPGQAPDEIADRSELIALVRRVLDDLPPLLRSVFVLSEIDGLSAAEVAQALDISKEAVRVRLHRARKALQARLARRIHGLLGEVYPFHLPRCDRVVEEVFRRLERMRT